MHYLCDKIQEQQVEARVQALLDAVGNNSHERIRPCDLHKLVNCVKLRNVCGIDGIPDECLRHLPKKNFGALNSSD
jgi:hypothetical protein